VWLSEIMLQQTTVKAVAPYYARFLARWPAVAALAVAPLGDVLKLWAGLGYYARARNLHACAKAVMERHGGRFPRSESALRALPGIGDYTAAAIAAIAFDAPAMPVDGNVERVVARLFAVGDELPAAKPAIRALAATLTPAQRAGDFAQAMMDLGATVCTPKKPLCAFCPWNGDCAAHARGDPQSFPRKAEKPVGRLRRGAAFVVVRADGAVLARTRPETGLLGGMTEVPTTEWSHDFDLERALEAAPRVSPLPGGERQRRPMAAVLDEKNADAKHRLWSEARRVRGLRPLRILEPPHPGPLPSGEREKWRRVPGVVTHTFTHFPLELVVHVANVGCRTRAPKGMRWISACDLAGEAFPNVMRKVLVHARVV